MTKSLFAAGAAGILAMTMLGGCLDSGGGTGTPVVVGGGGTSGGATAGGGTTGGGTSGGGTSSGGSTSGGSTSGGSLSQSEYLAHYDQIKTLIPTSDMPAKIQAAYKGATGMDVFDNASGKNVGTVMADLDLQLDWTDGQTSDPWSGRAHNFRGTVRDEALVVDGELTTAAANARGLDGTVGRVVNTINAPIVGPVTTATGAATIQFAGAVKQNGEDGTALLSLAGNAHDVGGRVLQGAAQGTWFGKSTGFAGVTETSAGSFFVERQ